VTHCLVWRQPSDSTSTHWCLSVVVLVVTFKVTVSVLVSIFTHCH